MPYGRGQQIGTGINPALSRVDYSPIERGGAAMGNAFNQVGGDIGDAIKLNKEMDKRAKSGAQIAKSVIDNFGEDSNLGRNAKEMLDGVFNNPDASTRDKVAAADAIGQAFQIGVEALNQQRNQEMLALKKSQMAAGGVGDIKGSMLTHGQLEMLKQSGAEIDAIPMGDGNYWVKKSTFNPTPLVNLAGIGPDGMPITGQSGGGGPIPSLVDGIPYSPDAGMPLPLAPPVPQSGADYPSNASYEPLGLPSYGSGGPAPQGGGYDNPLFPRPDGTDPAMQPQAQQGPIIAAPAPEKDVPVMSETGRVEKYDQLPGTMREKEAEIKDLTIEEMRLKLKKGEKDLTEKDKGAIVQEYAKAYKDNKAYVATRDIDKALKMLEGKKSGGFGGAINRMVKAKVPGTDEYNLVKGMLDPITNNIAFAQLLDMRQSSPTGGAVGQLSDPEREALQQAQGAIDFSLDPKIVRSNLQDLKMYYANVAHGTKQQRDKALKEGTITQAEYDVGSKLWEQMSGVNDQDFTGYSKVKRGGGVELSPEVRGLYEKYPTFGK